MDISYDNQHDKVLQSVTFRVIISTSTSHERGNDRDHYGEASNRRGGIEDSWLSRRPRKTIIERWQIARIQNRRIVACQPRRIAAIPEKSQEYKIASWEALNVRSLSSESLPDRSDNRPRFSVQANSLVRTIPLCKHTAKNGIAQRKRMSLQVVWCAQGGKCVAA